MRQRFSLVAILATLVLFSCSCRASAQSTPSTPAAPHSITSTALVLQDANLRAGPGANFARVGLATRGSTLKVVGANAKGDWLQLDDGSWIATYLVSSTPPTPTPGSGAQTNNHAQGTSVELVVGGWNLESGGADPNVVGQRIAALNGVDLWGLVEVGNEQDAAVLEAAAEEGHGADFAHLTSRSGKQDRMVILYNADRFTLLGQDELEYINLGGTTRAPLLAQLRDQESGQELVFMVNHLNRGDDARRHDQAALLNEWAINDTRPAIAVGDYNFDWAIKGGEDNHDLGYDYMTAQNEWHWVRPAQLTTTQCSGWPCRYNSVLDFTFTANGAQQWPAQAQIISVPGDFPDDETHSDHRPVLAWFQLPVAGAPSSTPVVQPTPLATPQADRLSILEVNKQDEYVIIQNNGSGAISLSGWILRSEKGSQDCPLDGILEAGQTLRIWAQNGAGFSCGVANSIWSNSGTDPAVLLDPNGREVARYQ